MCIYRYIPFLHKFCYKYTHNLVIYRLCIYVHIYKSIEKYVSFWTKLYDGKTLECCQLWNCSHSNAGGFSPSEGGIQTQAHNPRWSRTPMYLTSSFTSIGSNLGLKFSLTAVKNNFSRLLVKRQMSFQRWCSSGFTE